MPKRLYECSHTITYYAVAESAREAASMLRDAVDDADLFEADEVTVVTASDWPLEADWDEGCLIYRKEPGDMTLGEALEQHTNQVKS